MSAKGGTNGDFNYYGSIAAVVSTGQVDALLGLVIDGKTVWPVNDAWTVGTVYVLGKIVSYLGLLWVSNTSHTATTGNAPGVGVVWDKFSVTRISSANPYSFDVPGLGTAYFYWGTSSQTLSDGVLDATHPNYRNSAIIVLNNFLFGQGRTTAPNVEVCVQRAPAQTVISSTYNSLLGGQANPAAILLDAATDQVTGGGLPNSLFDATSWAALAAKYLADPSRYYISPQLTTATTVRQLFAEILSYSDAWIRFNSVGKIEAGWFEHQPASAPTFTDAKTLDVYDLLGEEPELTPDGWNATFNEAFVKFSDEARSYKDGSSKAANQMNRTIVGEPRPTTIDRKYITQRAQADAYAAEAVKMLGTPLIEGTLTVRAEKAASIKSGDRFLFTSDQFQFSIICRCVEKTIMAPPSGGVKIKFESERALNSAFVRSAPTTNQPVNWADPELLAWLQIWQPPPSLVDSQDNTISILAARTDPVTAGFRFWFRLQDQTLFQDIGIGHQFASFGLLAQNYGAASSSIVVLQYSRLSNVMTITTNGHHNLSGGTIYGHNVPGMVDGTGYAITGLTLTTLTFSNTGANVSTTSIPNAAISILASTLSGGLDDYSQTLQITLPTGAIQRDMDDRFVGVQTKDQIADATVLVMLFTASAPPTVEICALISATLVSGSTYAIEVSRNRYGNNMSAFSTGDRCFVLPREGLSAFPHAAIEAAIIAGGGIALMRPTAFNARAERDPGDIPVSTSTRARTSNVATLVTATPHRLLNGDTIMVQSMGAAAYNTASPVGVTVTNATTFTYPSTGSNESTTADTAGVIDRALSLVDAFAPVLTWVTIQRNGVDYASVWSPTNSSATDTFFFAWSGQDNSGDMNFLGLEALSAAGVKVQLYSNSFTPRTLQAVNQTFHLAAGTWTVTAVAQDSTGRVVRKDLQPVGGGSPITIVVV